MSAISDYRGIFSLAGKKAIVTGGSRGIGKALAEGLAAHGADVAIVVQSTVERAEAVANGDPRRGPRRDGDQGRRLERGRHRARCRRR